jgi:Arc/MetJ-type ribon-helix-helix transcriptional regulator
MSTETDERTVAIDEHLYERVERRIAKTDFESVDEYVAFVLEEVVAGDETDEAYEDVDEDDVQSRLRSLGYLDA